MKLINCHIENFGKLSDFSVDFKENLTVFRRENGWGKSTLAAFLRVMFFGFEGEAKRKGIENERKRYAPWQGGIYGGQILFETGGKRYVLSRVFADKKQNDVFELRDAATNLTSDDFSDNLGEEIFRMNSESFRRSVFIGQNDCVTHATDGINAKIGNLADSRNDLDCFEKASALLTGELNRLNPRRKTGEIFRVRAELTALETQAAAGETLAKTMEQCETLMSAERAALEEKRGERERLAGLAARVSRAQDEKAKLAMYARLLAECEEKGEAYRLARMAFPREVPKEEQLQSCLEACDELERARQMMQTAQADEAEQQFIKAWEAAHTEDLSAEKAIAQKLEKEQEASVGIAQMREAAESGKTENRKSEGLETAEGLSHRCKKKPSPVMCLAGVLFVVLGIVMVILGPGRSKGFFVTGILFMAIGALLLMLYAVKLAMNRKTVAFAKQDVRETGVHKEEERQDAQEPELRIKMEELQALWNALRQEEQELREQSKRYQMLLEKQKNYGLWKQKYELERRFLLGAFEEMGISLEEDAALQMSSVGILPKTGTEILFGDYLKKRLQEIWKNRILLVQAEHAWQSAKEKQEVFAKENHMEETVACADVFSGGHVNLQEEDTPTLESLNARMTSLDVEASAIRSRLRTYEQQLSGLREKYDVWTDTKEHLETVRARLSELKREYQFKQKAQQYLTQAKETLTARYMEPLMRSFSHYYQLIQKQDTGRYRMDANANLTVEEQGMQRETAYLSTGYQDLVGFCARLAFVDAMDQGEHPFLILDDPFVNLDDEKLAGARALLEDVAARYQIIYFTCSEIRAT